MLPAPQRRMAITQIVDLLGGVVTRANRRHHGSHQNQSNHHFQLL